MVTPEKSPNPIIAKRVLLIFAQSNSTVAMLLYTMLKFSPIFSTP